MIVVLGFYRGGSSAVAGVLHHLGVCMGHEIKVVPEAESPRYVTYEDWPLRRACLECFAEPDLQALRGFGGRVEILSRYLDERISGQPDVRDGRDTFAIPYDGCDHNPMGAKFPMLCLMGHELLEAWGDCTFVAVDRDLDDVAESAARWQGGRARDVVNMLHDAREAFLDGRDHVRVRYEDLVAKPLRTVDTLSAAIGLTPDAAQVAAAVDHVARPTYSEATA